MSPTPTTTANPLPPLTTPIPPAIPLSQSAPASKPLPPTWRLPTLKIRLSDLSSPGTNLFLSSIPWLPTLLSTATNSVLTHLYTPTTQPKHIKTITLHIRPFDGVAYTTGSRTKKHIHLSSSYVHSIAKADATREIQGVVLHEMVHVWQHNGRGTAPGGLIEGIADWVRLKEGFVPRHWKREGGKWDRGYQTTAYFLDWIEECQGTGCIRRLNQLLGEGTYGGEVWEKLCGETPKVERLWGSYTKEFGIPCDREGPGKQPGSEGEDESDSGDEDNDTSDSEHSAVIVKKKKKVVYHADSPPTPTRVQVILPTSPGSRMEDDDDSSYVPSEFSNPFAFTGESTMLEVFADRLKTLTFDGRADGKRFVKMFESLVEKIHPEIEEEGKKLLLVTALRGDVEEWYEETDLDDDLPYAVVIERLIKTWTGNGKRMRMLVVRDAKLS